MNNVDEAEAMRRILDQQSLVRVLKPSKQKNKFMEELITDANNRGLEASHGE